ncbi:MAG: cell division protein FtsQ/DivIB [Mycobacterium sp.]|jgi:cell division protein FtsQ
MTETPNDEVPDADPDDASDVESAVPEHEPPEPDPSEPELPEPEPTEAEPTEDTDGPRRRERRERAERRVAQQRATAIEQARREAKRKARGQVVAEPKRLTARSVKGLRLIMWSIVLAAASIALALVLYFTPAMAARSVVVIGVGTVTREEVVDAAQVRLGTPLLQIDTDAVADRVAGIRRVASARVQREYPSTLRISIVERIPLVVKDFPDGPHLFDRDGVDFATAPPPPGLPYIEVENPGPADPPTKAALQVMTALRPEVVAQVSRVAAPSVSSVTLTLADGRTVVWGTTDRTGEKAEKLAALLTQPGRVYDVSSPDLPTVK